MLARLPQASFPNRRSPRQSEGPAVRGNVCLMVNHCGGAVP